jgi:rhamnosyltransferase subunit B
MIHVEYAPYSELLPASAALVHHGGIGTVAMALRSGIPQFILPSSENQLDCGYRIRRLGVGDTMSKRRYQPEMAIPKIRTILESKQIHTNCQVYANLTQSNQDWGTLACEAMEKVLSNDPKTNLTI